MIFSLNVQLAALSERSDGDCGWRGPENRRAFLERCGMASGQLVCPSQIHSDTILRVPSGETVLGEGDALITDVRGVPLGITVADCVPVWIVADDASCGALAHAGREGTRKHIAAKAVAALRETFGAAPEHLHALIGPSAGPCCYEVSPELAARCATEGIPVQGRHLDLWTANFRQLEAAGLAPEHIRVSRLCTICGDRFFSFRRGDERARNLAVLAL